MKRLPAALLMAVALPVCAQHAVGHASAAPHSAPSFHAGFAPSRGSVSGNFAPHGPGPGQRMNGPTPHGVMPRMGGRLPARYMPGPTFGVKDPSTRSMGPGLHRPHYDPAHHPGENHREHDRGRPDSGPYYYANSTYLVPGYFGGGLIGYDEQDNAGYDAPAAQDDSQNDEYGNAGPYPSDDPSARPEYPAYPQSPAVAVHPAAVPEPSAITLVFNDGRAPMQIRNYALTRTTLYVLDAQHRDIPLTQLDIAATQKANQESGVDFRIPTSTN